jgi:3-dehydroquinate synthase
MPRLTVSVQPLPYEAIIESGILSKAGNLLRELLADSSPASRPIFVITIPHVRRRWGKALFKSLAAAGFKLRIVEMSDGERYKRLASIEKLAEKLAQSGADRNAVILAFGGGVVGDVAGLLASLYMRGVDVVQIPTTVLAQVDASIGGKTGVNLCAGKNLLGTFHQPRAVLIDPEVLATLPEREFRAGLYESIKCGVIGKPALFEVLARTEVRSLRADPAQLEEVIAESVKLKAEIVSTDERESGLRRVLNFGHTIGHALEAETGYRQFLHGEAVAWGMIAATNISAATDRLDRDIANRIREAMLRLGPLPTVRVNSRKILNLLQTDKKTRNGKLHFVLPREIGKVEIASNVPDKVVLEAVEELKRVSKT